MSNAYKDITVYEISYGHMNDLSDLYICRGAACDDWQQRFYDGIEKSKLFYDPNKPLEEQQKFYRVANTHTEKKTDWYPSMDEAREAAKNQNIGDETYNYDNTGELYTREIEPLSWPREVQFSQDDKGRLYTRLNAHPEHDGLYCRGKVFFPDRSFTNTDVGPAMVTIAKEFETYGFLTGDMVKYSMPDMEKFLDWAWENCDPASEVYFIKHPARGEYLILNRPILGISRVDIVTAPNGDTTICLTYEYERTDIEQYKEKTCRLSELYLKSAFGDNYNVESIRAKFKPCQFFAAKQRLSSSWVCSNKYHSDLVDKAVQCGLLNAYTLQGYPIEILELTPGGIHNMVEFTPEEMDKLAETVSSINTTADEAITTALRKGRLRIK